MNNTKNYDTKVAIVILNWNGKKYLEQFLPKLIDYSQYTEVQLYVADNGSTDKSINFVQKAYPQIKTIILDKNYGFAGGYNKALKQISAEYYILLNSDVEVSSNWIFPIIKKMDADPKVAAAMPKIKSWHNKLLFEYAGAAGGFIDKFAYPFCRGRILDTIEEDKGQYNDEHEIFWASGACLFIRSEVFHAQKGFDDDFFAHMEEIDLCWRIKNSGLKIMYYPEVQVFHIGGGALPNNNPFKLYLNYRNNLFMLYKNLPAKKLYPIIFSRMILDGLSAGIYLLSFSFSSFSAVFKAHISFYKSLKKLKQKRKNNLNRIKNIEHKEQFKYSILYKYFIKKQKTFNKLNF